MILLKQFSISKDLAKNRVKVKKGDRKVKKDDTKTGIRQVLIEPQQNFFHQHYLDQNIDQNCKF